MMPGSVGDREVLMKKNERFLCPCSESVYSIHLSEDFQFPY